MTLKWNRKFKTQLKLSRSASTCGFQLFCFCRFPLPLSVLLLFAWLFLPNPLISVVRLSSFPPVDDRHCKMGQLTLHFSKNSGGTGRDLIFAQWIMKLPCQISKPCTVMTCSPPDERCSITADVLPFANLPSPPAVSSFGEFQS